MDFQLVGLFIAIAGGGAGVVWRLTRVEANIRASINAETRSLNDKLVLVNERLAAVEKGQLEELAVVRRETTEAVNAIRAKLHEIETWARDEFVRKGSFETVIGRIEKAIETMGEKIEKRMDRLAERIETRERT